MSAYVLLTLRFILNKVRKSNQMRVFFAASLINSIIQEHEY